MPRPLRALFLVLLAACCHAAASRATAAARHLIALTSVIYVVKRRWHVDIGFAREQLQPPLASLRADLPQAAYLLFGFGDRHYLLDQDRGPGGILVALWPGPGLMLATGLTNSPQAAFGDANVIEIAVTPAWRATLSSSCGAVCRWTMEPPPHCTLGPMRAASTAQRLRITRHTCNTWAAQALHAAGLPVKSFGIEFSGQVWRQVQRIGISARRRPDGYQSAVRPSPRRRELAAGRVRYRRAYDRGARICWHDHRRGFLRRGRAAAADAPRHSGEHHKRSQYSFHDESSYFPERKSCPHQHEANGAGIEFVRARDRRSVTSYSWPINGISAAFTCWLGAHS